MYTVCRLELNKKIFFNKENKKIFQFSKNQKDFKRFVMRLPDRVLISTSRHLHRHPRAPCCWCLPRTASPWKSLLLTVPCPLALSHRPPPASTHSLDILRPSSDHTHLSQALKPESRRPKAVLSTFLPLEPLSIRLQVLLILPPECFSLPPSSYVLVRLRRLLLGLLWWASNAVRASVVPLFVSQEAAPASFKTRTWGKVC